MSKSQGWLTDFWANTLWAEPNSVSWSHNTVVWVLLFSTRMWASGSKDSNPSSVFSSSNLPLPLPPHSNSPIHLLLLAQCITGLHGIYWIKKLLIFMLVCWPLTTDQPVFAIELNAMYQGAIWDLTLLDGSKKSFQSTGLESNTVGRLPRCKIMPFPLKIFLSCNEFKKWVIFLSLPDEKYGSHAIHL